MIGNRFIVFLFTGFIFNLFFLLLTPKAYAAACDFIVDAKSDSSNPTLPSPGQQVKVDVEVQNPPGCTDGGAGERINMVWELKIGEGNFNYSYFTPQLDSYTLAADIPSGLSAFHTFTTTIQAGNSCATSGKVWALASFTAGNQTATAVSESDHGVGAKLTGTIKDLS